jgi:siderophore synthetase component
VLPELHGQNVVLLMRRGKPERLLIRDHDTLRICPDWMKRAGVPEISYVLKPGTRNTLVLPSLEELLAYLQTLVIQVNLASVMEAFVKGGHFTGDEGWSMVEEILRDELARIESPELAEEARRVLLLAEDWPMKEIIAPLLRRQGTGGGSMPSGMGRIANPFRRSG